jgi:hypothetical protein
MIIGGEDTHKRQLYKSEFFRLYVNNKLLAGPQSHSKWAVHCLLLKGFPREEIILKT